MSTLRASLRFAMLLILTLCLAARSTTLAQAPVWQPGEIETDDLGVPNPAGLTFSPLTKSFLVVHGRRSGQLLPDGSTTVQMISPFDRSLGSVHLPTVRGVDPLNMAFDPISKRLLFYHTPTKQLIEIPTTLAGFLNSSGIDRVDARRFNLQNPQGMTFDAATGKMMPGQSFSPEVARPGTSEANAMVTTTGRYVVQKAELSSPFFYYMLQGNYNLFNTSAASYDDVSETELAAMSEMSASLNYFIFGPIDEEGIVPDAWKVPQPMSGLAIYEPVSFVASARNQVEMAKGLVDFAQANLCVTAGCDPEEAAARLGYAAWNLDKAFGRQIGEAIERGEIAKEAGDQLAADAGLAAAACRGARGQLLAAQPRLPDADALAAARAQSTSCADALRSLAEGL